MKNSFRYILATAVLLPAVAATAQKPAGEGVYAIKATADIGLGKSMNAKSVLPGMSTSGSTFDFDLDFGWTFWKQDKHSLEANIGIGYGSTGLKSRCGELDFHYSAPAEADEDRDTYIRYCEMEYARQKMTVYRLTIPLYLNYKYQINDIVGVHAFVGYKLGINTSAKVTSAGAELYSYGVYPQYDDLLIDADYLNEFGERHVMNGKSGNVGVNRVSSSIIAGLGAEFNIWGPLAADLSFRYEGMMTNMFKPSKVSPDAFDAQTAPVTYTVAGGQRITPFSTYLKNSKLSKFSLGISLIYRF